MITMTTKKNSLVAVEAVAEDAVVVAEAVAHHALY